MEIFISSFNNLLQPPPMILHFHRSHGPHLCCGSISSVIAWPLSFTLWRVVEQCNSLQYKYTDLHPSTIHTQPLSLSLSVCLSILLALLLETQPLSMHPCPPGHPLSPPTRVASSSARATTYSLNDVGSRHYIYSHTHTHTHTHTYTHTHILFFFPLDLFLQYGV